MVCIWVARIVEKVFLGSDNGLWTQKKIDKFNGIKHLLLRKKRLLND